MDCRPVSRKSKLFVTLNMETNINIVFSDLQITSSRHYISFIVKTPLPEDIPDTHTNGKTCILCVIRPFCKKII